MELSSLMPRAASTKSAGARVPVIAGPASSTSQTPSGKAAADCVAVSKASRVLPTPPGPVSVTSRRSFSSARSSTTAAVRPTTPVSVPGMLVRGRAARVGGAGAPCRAGSCSRIAW